MNFKIVTTDRLDAFFKAEDVNDTAINDLQRNF